MRAILILMAFASTALAEDWPKWRGPHGDNTWYAPKLPDKWPANGLKKVWKRPIGGGYAGISVADGRLYTLDLEKPQDRTAKGDAPDGTERVLCLDAKTGDTLWSHSYAVRYGKLDYANGPRSQPTFHEGKLYTLGAVGHLFCFDAKTGKILWQHDTVKTFGAKVPMWGYAAAPVIDGDRLIVHVAAQPGGCFLALDRHTGKELWRSGSDDAGYATPILILAKSGRQLVGWTPAHVLGLDPDTGKRLWSVPHKINYDVSITTPIFRDDTVFVSEYWDGSLAIRLGAKPTDAEVIWENKKTLRGLMVPPLYRDGFVYSMDRDRGLSCVELKTGKIRWDDDNRLTPKSRNPHLAMVWVNDTDRSLILNAVGELILARLTPNGCEEHSRTKVLNGRVWSHPAFVGSRMFARTDGGEAWQSGAPYELVCVELAP